MMSQLKLGDLVVDVTLKEIKNVHLSVYPPTGAVRISAPVRMDMDTIRVFAISKLDWIREQQATLREQQRETRREYITGESHYLWGRRYLLEVVESNRPHGVELDHARLWLHVRPGTTTSRMQAIVDRWYRDQLKQAVPPLIAKWEPVIGVSVERFFVQRMKTKWGGCNARSRSIRLNPELAKKPRQCLEYIVVHELVHLVEPTHGPRFVSLMDRVMPEWRFQREQLNRLPVRQEVWTK